MLERSVQHLKTYCEQRAQSIQDDDDRRNAYEFLARQGHH